MRVVLEHQCNGALDFIETTGPVKFLSAFLKNGLPGIRYEAEAGNSGQPIKLRIHQFYTGQLFQMDPSMEYIGSVDFWNWTMHLYGAVMKPEPVPLEVAPIAERKRANCGNHDLGGSD